MNKDDIEYGVFEGYPARWNDREAWVCWRGEWKSFAPMEVWFNARVVGAPEYHKLFAPVPNLPIAAFPGSSPKRPEEPAVTPAESMAELLQRLPGHVRVAQRHGVAIGVVGYPRPPK